MTGFTNPPIGQTLAASGLKQLFCSFRIRNLQGGVAIITEIELCKVAMRVCFAAMLVNTDHATLEDWKTFSIVFAAYPCLLHGADRLAGDLSVRGMELWPVKMGINSFSHLS